MEAKAAICSVTVSGQTQTEPGTQTGGIIDPATSKTRPPSAAWRLSWIILLQPTTAAIREPGVAIQDAYGNDL